MRIDIRNWSTSNVSWKSRVTNTVNRCYFFLEIGRRRNFELTRTDYFPRPFFLPLLETTGSRASYRESIRTVASKRGENQVKQAEKRWKTRPFKSTKKERVYVRVTEVGKSVERRVTPKLSRVLHLNECTVALPLCISNDFAKLSHPVYMEPWQSVWRGRPSVLATQRSENDRTRCVVSKPNRYFA